MTPDGNTPTPLVVRTPAELRSATSRLLRSAPQRTGAVPPSLGLVPTMGGLHAGHAELVRTARGVDSVVVVSIFVNPLQFGDPADLERYPRTFDADLRLLAGSGADIVFAPSVGTMYPGGEPQVRVSAGRMGEVFEGASRPGHFDGMLTVVSKLLHLGLPATDAAYRAYFGEKDAQQLALIRRMVLDLNVPVDVRGVPIVRDPDGLALSSRNRFLEPAERRAALVLSRVLTGLGERAARGEALDLAAARTEIDGEDGVDLDYLDVVDPASFTPLTGDAGQGVRHGDVGHTGGVAARDEAGLVDAGRRALAVVAARVGAVRLIDNTLLTPPDRGASGTADR